MRKLAGAIAAIAFFASASSASADITSVFKGDVTCAVQSDGVRFCGSSSPRSTTKTFDGMPIDVNAAFPPAPASGPDGPYPLIIIGHGYGGSKLGLSDMQPFLDRGYATFSMTDRGFGESCGLGGVAGGRPDGLRTGYIRLMDDRYEVRDAQFFAGELVDAGPGAPGQDRRRPGVPTAAASRWRSPRSRTARCCRTDRLVPWKSPNGTPMSLAARRRTWPVDGHRLLADAEWQHPRLREGCLVQGQLGGEKKSLEDGLYFLGCSFNFCAPVGTDPDADITGWKDLIEAGEPYVGNPKITDILDELQSHHSSYGIDHSRAAGSLPDLERLHGRPFPRRRGHPVL